MAFHGVINENTASQSAQGQLSYTVLQQLDRPNRFATLEVWDTETDYSDLHRA
jgi:quinol monooxygenase YgiN